MTPPTTTEPTDGDIAAVLTSMSREHKLTARSSTGYGRLAREKTVPGLLRAACVAMERAIVDLAITLSTELEVHIGVDRRDDLLNIAVLKQRLTDRYRLDGAGGCVDRAIREMVRLYTGGAQLDAEQWRLACNAITRAASAVVRVALDAEDLLQLRFGTAPNGNAARYLLLKGLPKLAHDMVPMNVFDYADSTVFERLAAQL